MTSFRHFIFIYSPLFTLGVIILGLYSMAACISLSLNIHP